MKDIKPSKTFEFVITQKITYNVQGDGRTEFEARQDAMERFHRLSKSKEIVPDVVGRPAIQMNGKLVNRK